jgi:hypothetical protein
VFVVRQVKLLGLALLAVFALGAVLSSVASALDLIQILPLGSRNWTGENDGTAEPELVGLFGSVKCKKAAASGTEEEKHPLGEYHIEFKECKDNLNNNCTGIGDEPTTGLILALGTWHLVYDVDSTSELGLATLFLQSTVVKFKCGGLLIEVKGEVLCLDLEWNVLKLSHLFHCHQKEALQLDTLWWNDDGTSTHHEKAELLCSLNGLAFAHCAELALGLVKHSTPLIAMD